MATDFVKQRMNQITDSIALATKTQVFDSAMQFLQKAGTLRSVQERGVQATIFNNFKSTVMDSVDGTTRGQQITTMADFGPYVPEVLPVITAWYSQFPLRDLISIQEMTQPLAFLLFSVLQTGTNKAPTVVGQLVETPLGQRQINGYYPTGEIIGEQIPGSQLQISGNKLIGVVNYHALKASGQDGLTRFKLTVNVNGTKTVYRALSQVGGELLLTTQGGTAPVTDAVWDIASGAFYLPTSETDTTAITVTANYVWDLDYADDENIPKVKEHVVQKRMEARPRVLAMQWTIFAEALKRAQFKRDIREENTRRVLELMYQYQTRYVLDTMYEDAMGEEITVNVNTNNVYSLEVQYNTVLRQLNKAAGRIEIVSGRMRGNRLVVGTDFYNWLDSLPENLFRRAKEEDSFSTARFVGYLGSYQVFYDPQRGSDEGFMCYRGSQWYDASAYMGVFLPLVPTDAISLNVTVKQAFADMLAWRYDKPETVIPIKFVIE